MLKCEQFLSPEAAKELWQYDPATGLLYWARSPCNPIPAGSIAGNLDTEGYVRVQHKRYRYMAHRIAWVHITGAWPSSLLDHKDLDRANNRADNLREAEAPNNMANRRRGRGANLRGAQLHRNGVRWAASCAHVHIGMFATEQEAHEAYKKAAIERYGEFARFD